jgi:hypothetical protein
MKTTKQKHDSHNRSKDGQPVEVGAVIYDPGDWLIGKVSHVQDGEIIAKTIHGTNAASFGVDCGSCRVIVPAGPRGKQQRAMDQRVIETLTALLNISDANGEFFDEIGGSKSPAGQEFQPFSKAVREARDSIINMLARPKREKIAKVA